MKITYYLEVTSSWCHWVEPTWAELQRRYAGRAEFGWKIALMDAGDFPTSHAQYDWFLERSSAVMQSPVVLKSTYYDLPTPGAYPAASAVAEAARELGVTGDEVRVALSRAAYREGLPVGRLDVAVAVAAAAGGLDATILRARAQTPEIAERLRATTAEFHALGVAQRPAFVLESAIGDRAVFSGIVRLDPFVATFKAMLADTAAYAEFGRRRPGPPA
ncbi:MAG: DsbA family protein [Candidatus Didemnitutus sp.]|nr:DsbA family protein [Candidatus Didemnitutus sp.]